MPRNPRCLELNKASHNVPQKVFLRCCSAFRGKEISDLHLPVGKRTRARPLKPSRDKHRDNDPLLGVRVFRHLFAHRMLLTCLDHVTGAKHAERGQERTGTSSSTQELATLSPWPPRSPRPPETEGAKQLLASRYHVRFAMPIPPRSRCP